LRLAAAIELRAYTNSRTAMVKAARGAVTVWAALAGRGGGAGGGGAGAGGRRRMVPWS
jgi:hypothetical protein